MREIATHKVNGLNEALKLLVLDDPGAGGANHKYRIEWNPNGMACNSCDVHFQNGPIAESGINGISQEALLAIVRDRLECFQAGPYACDTNATALQHVIAAMDALHSRTKERMARGVEGTSQK
jgi:hypothetical protein